MAEKSEPEKRKELGEEELKQLFYEWITGKKSLRQLAEETGIPRSTLHRHFQKLRAEGISLDEFVESFARKVPAEIRDDYRKALRSFLSMDEEERIELVRKSIGYFAELAKRNPVEAFNRFVEWLNTPDGMIMYGYLWRPEFVEDVNEATVALLKMVARIV